jgi:outer membrane protein OmpA-like peptidoglycan-associated protein/tetratricopeptide (TPR) repeat protein
MKNIILKSLSFLMIILLLSACYSANITKGDAATEDLAYVKAVKYYEKAIKYKNTPEANAKLALAYEHLNNFKEAEDHFTEALKSDTISSIIKFNAAKSLISNKKVEEGKKVLREYLEDNPDDVSAREWLSDKSRKGEFLEYDTSLYTVEPIVLEEFIDAYGAYKSNGSLYFVATKPKTAGIKKNPWTGNSFTDIYKVDQINIQDMAYDRQTNESGASSSFPNERKLHSGFVYSKPQKAISTLLHDGSIAVNSLGTSSYVTGSYAKKNGKGLYDDDKINQLQITEYRLDIDGKWKFYRDLPINDPNSSAKHPSVTRDNSTLFFSSDRAGGEGGSDLYMSQMIDGEWSPAVNLGEKINTNGNEAFPYAYKNDTLFFASDGHGGMGGLDIFISTFDGEDWSHPKNLKAPFNSNHDDFSLFKNEDNMSGYFSSNRGGKDQIYHWYFTEPTFTLVGKVVDVDKKPSENTTIVLKENEIVIDSIQSNNVGDFSMPLDWQKEYEIYGHNKTLLTDTANASTVGRIKSDSIMVRLELEAPEFLVKGIVIDKKSKERLSGVKVELLSMGDKIENEMLSGTKGEFLFKLDRNKAYNLYGFKKKNFSRKIAVSTVDLKESKIFEVVLELEEAKPDVPIVLQNIYYDYNKWDIRKDAEPELNNLFKFMRDNDKLRIELSSHTDSRGTHKYNYGLSRKRAESAVNYLIAKGIAADRFQFIGHGETKLINDCKDGVECSEEKHQQNRRTEFKLIKLD